MRPQPPNRTFRKFGIFALVLLTVGGAFAAWGYRNLTAPYAHGAANEVVTIEPGLGTRGILVRLAQAGVISNRLPLLVYLTLRPRPLQAGDYLFESPITPLQAIEKIRRGQVVTGKVTVPEGYDIFDLAETLAKRDTSNPESAEEIDRALRATDPIKDLDPRAETLEGYLFPDTYTYPLRASSRQLTAQMARHFIEVFTPEMRARAQELGLTVRQVVTLASLIECEAKVDEDRPLISSVFHNRMKKGMRMDCDPTFIYAAKLEKRWDGNVNNPAHRRSPSPYNTYAVAGLPPGPISSPGLKSLRAALYPATTDYIFFVASEGGKHRFSRTETEHLAAVADYRRRLKAQTK